MELKETNLAVEWVPIARLFCSPANPRLNDQAVPHVAASIRRFGWRQPVVAKPSGEVIAGNTRLKAAKELGAEVVPVVWFEGEDLEATAYAIADNRTHEFAEWDSASLARILEDLRAEDALDGVGYSSDDIDALLAELAAGADDLADVVEDQAPEPGDAAITRPGDLWVCGTHRLLCGDSSRWDDVERLLNGERIHLVNMDPPYNVRVEPRSNNAIAAGLSSFAPTHHQGLDLACDPTKAQATGKMRPKDRPLVCCSTKPLPSPDGIARPFEVPRTAAGAAGARHECGGAGRPARGWQPGWARDARGSGPRGGRSL